MAHIFLLNNGKKLTLKTILNNNINAYQGLTISVVLVGISFKILCWKNYTLKSV